MADNANYSIKCQQYQNQANSNNPSKFYTHFIYKVLVVSIFLVLLPLFPSQAPEFINQALNSRGWEFLHLIFVGIAVSYGLFSRRNDETDKDNNNSNINNNSKFDNAQSYVSRLLQVSSVFDDDVSDNSSRSDGSSATSVQTWNNQYYRNDPVVVVAEGQQHSVLDQEQRCSNISGIGEKPLLLPVRSLKSRVMDADGNQTSRDSSSGVSAFISRSNSNLGSKRFSSNSIKSGLHHQDLEEKMNDNIVLPSPIPWRSRSGRMEMKETKEETDNLPSYTLPPSMEESEYNRFFRGQVPVSRSARSDSSTSSPKLSRSASMSSPKKFSTSPAFSAETQGKSAEDFVRKKNLYRSPPPPPPPPPFSQMSRRSRTMGKNSSQVGDEDFIEKDLKPSLSMPKSVRTTRGNDSFTISRKEKEFDHMINNYKADQRITGGFNQASIRTDRLNSDRVAVMPQPAYMELSTEEKEELVENLEETENDSDDDEATVGSSFVSCTTTKEEEEEEEASSGNASDEGPDVDKKADEFIAKFREQIRLQRIESIKISSGQINRKASSSSR